MASDTAKLKVKDVRYLAFEGGGAMGVSYLGPLVALEELGVLPSAGSTQIDGVSGTSIGAIVAMCVGMGYSAKDINARLVKDRAYSVLHAETLRKGVARKFTYDGKGDKSSNSEPQTEGEMGSTPGEIDKLWQRVRELLAAEADKRADILKDGILSFVSDWLSGTVTAMLADKRLITEHIYEGAIKALRKNKKIVQAPMFASGWIRSWIDEAAGDNQFFVTQFNAWLAGDPFEEGVFEKERDRELYIYTTLGMLVLGVVLYYSIALRFGGEKEDTLRNKFLLLGVVGQNYAFNASQPWLYRGWKNIGKDLIKIAEAAQLDAGPELLRESFQSLEEKIGQYALSFVTSKHFNALKEQFLDDGALFSGLTVRVILAEAIYARVEVDEKGGFKKREQPIRWGNQIARDHHPALSRKAEEQKREEYRRLSRLVQNEGTSVIPRNHSQVLKRRTELEKEIEGFDVLDKERDEQIKAIMTGFTLDDYAKIFDVELCVTGTNITTGRSCYFNRYITPAMPVVDAVGISSSFPFLFKPTRLEYTGSRSPHDCYDPNYVAENFVDGGKQIYPPPDLKSWYKANYFGWFIDGGLLTNVPIHAFNGHASNHEKLRALDPINMRQEPLNPSVLGLVLDQIDSTDPETGADAEAKAKWKGQVDDFKADESPPGLIDQFMAILYKTPGVHATYSGLPTKAFRRNQVLLVDTPGVTLFDIVPLESSLRDSDWSGYNRMWDHFEDAGNAKRAHSNRKSFSDHFERDNRDSRRWRRSAAQIAQRRATNRLARRVARSARGQ